MKNYCRKRISTLLRPRVNVLIRGYTSIVRLFYCKMHNATDYTKLVRFLFVVSFASYDFWRRFRLGTPVTAIPYNIVDITVIYSIQRVTAKKVNIIGAIQVIKGIASIQMNSHFKMANAKVKIKVFVTTIYKSNWKPRTEIATKWK